MEVDAMRRPMFDLLLIVTMFLGLTYLYDKAIGNVTEELSNVVALVFSLIIPNYVVFVVIPHYSAKIRDTDFRRWIEVAKLSILVVVVWIIMMGGDAFDSEPDRGQLAIVVGIAVIVFSTIRLVYTKVMFKRSAKHLEDCKRDSE